MAQEDRLRELAGCHVVLRRLGLTNAERYRAAGPDELRQLHRYEHTIRRLVAESHADVLLALWPTSSNVSWQVAGVTTEPTARLLSVTRGPVGGPHTDLLKLRYDDARGERIAWRRLIGVLR